MTRTILAYLDPGSSSMILQMLLGGVAAAGVALKLYWRRLLRFLRIRKDEPSGSSAPVTTGATAATTATTATADGAAEARAAEPAETTKR